MYGWIIIELHVCWWAQIHGSQLIICTTIAEADRLSNNKKRCEWRLFIKNGDGPGQTNVRDTSHPLSLDMSACCCGKKVSSVTRRLRFCSGTVEYIRTSYSLRDPDWDIVHRKTSQLTSRKFFIEDVSPGLLPASSVNNTKYKKPRPFIGAQIHTNVGITPETVMKFFPKRQITFPVPTLNSTGSHSTFGSCLRRCPAS